MQWCCALSSLSALLMKIWLLLGAEENGQLSLVLQRHIEATASLSFPVCDLCMRWDKECPQHIEISILIHLHNDVLMWCLSHGHIFFPRSRELLLLKCIALVGPWNHNFLMRILLENTYNQQHDEIYTRVCAQCLVQSREPMITTLPTIIMMLCRDAASWRSWIQNICELRPKHDLLAKYFTDRFRAKTLRCMRSSQLQIQPQPHQLLTLFSWELVFAEHPTLLSLPALSCIKPASIHGFFSEPSPFANTAPGYKSYGWDI